VFRYSFGYEQVSLKSEVSEVSVDEHGLCLVLVLVFLKVQKVHDWHPQLKEADKILT
jgi:hypothetical protein